MIDMTDAPTWAQVALLLGAVGFLLASIWGLRTPRTPRFLTLCAIVIATVVAVLVIDATYGSLPDGEHVRRSRWVQWGK